MEKYLKKVFLNLGTLSLLSAPVSLSFSCSPQEKVDMMILIDKTTQIKNTSFTQGIIDAMENQGKKDGFKVNYQQVISNDREGRKKTIENSIANGTTNFAIASFSFNDDLKFLSESFPEAKFIAIDTKDNANLKNIANVWAESQEGAFLGGYLTAKTASDKVKENSDFFAGYTKVKGDKINFGYVGGFAFETVTRFYDGVVSGMKFWNDKNDDDDFDINFIYDFDDKQNKDDKAYANDWDYESVSYKAAFKELIDQNVNIVIGSPESVAKYNKENPNTKIWQIANDYDIKDDDPDAESYTFTSILKNIGEGAALIAHDLIAEKNTKAFINGRVIGQGINTGVMGVALNNLDKKTYYKIFETPYYLVDNASKSNVDIYNGLELKELVQAAKDAKYRQK